MTTVMKLKIMTTMGRIVQVLIVPSSSTPRPLNTKGGFVCSVRFHQFGRKAYDDWPEESKRQAAAH
jgi:hypothetical protein